MGDPNANKGRPVEAVDSEGSSGYAAPFPHLTREDLALLRGLPRAKAREMERLIREQYRGDRAFRAFACTEADLGEPGALEQVHGQRTSRWSHGTGGGRRTERQRGAD